MPRTKSDTSTEITVRFRARHEAIIRLKRDALFFGVQWTELASAVLHGFSAGQEQFRKDKVRGPVEDIPRRKYTRVEDLPLRSHALFLFYSAQLAQLHQATSMEQRAAIAEQEFVADEWLPKAQQSTAHEQAAHGENDQGTTMTYYEAPDDSGLNYPSGLNHSSGLDNSPGLAL